MSLSISTFLKNFFRKDIFGGGSWLMLSNIASSVANLGIVYILANFTSEETFGTYKYALAVFSLLAISTLPGIGTAVVRSVSRGYDASITHALRKQILFGFIGSAGGFAIATYYFIQGNDTLALLFVTIGVFVPFTQTFTLYRSYLNGKKQYQAIAIDSIIFNTLFFLSFGGTILLFNDVVIIVAAYLLYTTIINFSLYRLTLKQFPSTDDREDKELFSYSKHLTILKMFTNASGALQNIALWHFLGPAALPIYALAVAPTEQIRPFFKSISGVLLPKMSADNWKLKNVRWFLHAISPFMSVLVGLILLYISLAPSLFATLFPKYPDSVLLSQILAVGLLFTSVNSVLSVILKAKKRVQELYITHIAQLVLDGISIVAILYFGLIGLVVSIVIKKIIMLMINIWSVFYFPQKNQRP